MKLKYLSLEAVWNAVLKEMNCKLLNIVIIVADAQ